MIAFRKAHRVLRLNVSEGACGFPDTSFHGEKPWRGQFASHERYVGVMFAGHEEDGTEDVVYVASNAYWEKLEVLLPSLPEGMCWSMAVDTWEERQRPGQEPGETFVIGPRSVKVFVGVRK